MDSPSATAGAAGPAGGAASTRGGAAGGAASSHLKIEGKLVMIGDSFSGKTSIIQQFVNPGASTAGVRPSIGVAYSKQTVQVPGATVILSVWDTAGQEKVRRRVGRGAARAQAVASTRPAARPQLDAGRARTPSHPLVMIGDTLSLAPPPHTPARVAVPVHQQFILPQLRGCGDRV